MGVRRGAPGGRGVRQVAVAGVVGDEVGDGRAGADDLGRVPVQAAAHKPSPGGSSAMPCAAAHGRCTQPAALPLDVLSAESMCLNNVRFLSAYQVHASCSWCPYTHHTAVHDGPVGLPLCEHRLPRAACRKPSLQGTLGGVSGRAPADLALGARAGGRGVFWVGIFQV